MHPNARTLHSDSFIFHCEAAQPLTFSAWWCPDNVSLGWLRWMPEFWPLKTPCASCCGHVAFPREKNLWVGSAVYLGVWAERLFLCCTACMWANADTQRLLSIYLNFAWRRRWALQHKVAAQAHGPFWASFWVQEKNETCFFFHGPWLSIFFFCVLKRLGGGKTW